MSVERLTSMSTRLPGRPHPLPLATSGVRTLVDVELVPDERSSRRAEITAA